MEVSSTSMNVASITASAINQGFTAGALCVVCAGVIPSHFQDETRMDLYRCSRPSRGFKNVLAAANQIPGFAAILCIEGFIKSGLTSLGSPGTRADNRRLM